jgi:hypothetical protein
MIDNEELCRKSITLYPDIGECGITIILGILDHF